MTTFPVVPAIERARAQSEHGPRFLPDTCLATVADFMLGHASGVDTAFLGWEASTEKHRYAGGDLEKFLHSIPRGFPVWFHGGTPSQAHPQGDGHVVISGTVDYCWSLDRLRPGFYDRVPIRSILTWNRVYPLGLLGWTGDLAGFPLPYKPGSKDPRP